MTLGEWLQTWRMLGAAKIKFFWLFLYAGMPEAALILMGDRCAGCELRNRVQNYLDNLPTPSRGHGTPCDGAAVFWLVDAATVLFGLSGPDLVNSNFQSCGERFMHLTLRTLLAYMDGILEPEDRDEIGRKIEESEFARQLVQRLRDSTRNPRLSAPRVMGKGMGPDPNTVAEYLDNTLAGERVPEFEKLCLDSDIDLAEVAACHQILTMVLGQPAEIDMEMKQHMYEVVNHSTPVERKAGETPEHVAGVPDDMWVKPKRRKPEIPDYLREQPGGSKWKTYTAAAIVLGVVAVAVMLALGPLDRTHPVARLLGFGPAVENVLPAVPEANAKQEPGADEKASAAEEERTRSGQKCGGSRASSDN